MVYQESPAKPTHAQFDLEAVRRAVKRATRAHKHQRPFLHAPAWIRGETR